MARTQNGYLGPRDRPTDTCGDLKPPLARIFTRISVWLSRNRRPWSTEIWQSRFLLCACGLLLSTSSETTGVTSPVAQQFIFLAIIETSSLPPVRFSPQQQCCQIAYLYNMQFIWLKICIWVKMKMYWNVCAFIFKFSVKAFYFSSILCELFNCIHMLL